MLIAIRQYIFSNNRYTQRVFGYGEIDVGQCLQRYRWLSIFPALILWLQECRRQWSSNARFGRINSTSPSQQNHNKYTNPQQLKLISDHLRTHIEEYLTSLTLDEMKQCLNFQPQNILSIIIGGLGSSSFKLAIKCLLTPLNSPQRSGYISSQQEQRILKLQSQNFQLKLKLELLNNKVEEQEERIKEITDWVKTEMFRMREQFEDRIDEHTLQLQKESKMSEQDQWRK